MTTPSDLVENERLEIALLLEGIYRKYGYDFRNYAASHTKRRLEYRLEVAGLANYSEMLHRVIHDESFLNQILRDLSINVTEMFRDPQCYRSIRETIIPHLKTYPFIKIWHAGCSAGQEVYSMSILLEEEQMKNRSQIYATDFNEIILSEAQKGIYPIDVIKEYTANYQKSGGSGSFSDYYTADSENVILANSLREQILFSSHNLATDGVFGEMHMIFCRNVLIYFNRELQNRVLTLFHESLLPGGFLCLGSKESLKFSSVADLFELIAEPQIYRKKR